MKPDNGARTHFLSVPHKKKKRKKMRAAVPKSAPILCSMQSYTGFVEIQTVGKKKKRTVISLTDSAF